MADNDPCLVVFARTPVPGRVKTRLCQRQDGEPATLTEQQAAAVYAAFIADVCLCGQRSGILRRRLYVAGDPAHPHIEQVARDNGFTVRTQQGQNLGDRMAAAIDAELAAGAGSVILLGTDSPTLPVAYLHSAVAFLTDAADVVLGPANDGGYYLIGTRRSIPSVFAAGMPWGTSQVLNETLVRLRRLADQQIEVALLPFFYDVDTPYELRLLARHLRLADRPDGAVAPGTVGSAANLLADLRAPASYAVLKDLGWL